jgi:hypothetical protein
MRKASQRPYKAIENKWLIMRSPGWDACGNAELRHPAQPRMAQFAAKINTPIA